MSTTGAPRPPSPYGPEFDRMRAERDRLKAERAARQAAAEPAPPVRREQITKREVVDRLFELKPLLDAVAREQRDRSTPAFKVAREAFHGQGQHAVPAGDDLLARAHRLLRRRDQERTLKVHTGGHRQVQAHRGGAGAARPSGSDAAPCTADQRRMARNQAYAHIVDPDASPLQQMAGFMMVNRYSTERLLTDPAVRRPRHAFAA